MPIARTCAKCGNVDERDSEDLNEACPGCGRFYKKMLPSAAPKRPQKESVWWARPSPGSALIAILIVSAGVAWSLTHERPSSTSDVSAPSDCGSDVECLANQQEFSANNLCKRAIEARLKYEFTWNGTFGQVFEQRRAINASSVAMAGTLLKAQNGFGAWKKISYGCTYNVFSKSVEYVYVN